MVGGSQVCGRWGTAIDTKRPATAITGNCTPEADHEMCLQGLFPIRTCYSSRQYFLPLRLISSHSCSFLILFYRQRSKRKTASGQWTCRTSKQRCRLWLNPPGISRRACLFLRLHTLISYIALIITGYQSEKLQTGYEKQAEGRLTKYTFRYRTLTPKSRVIPLPAPFLSYLRSDSIVLPPEDKPPVDSDDDLDDFSDDEAEESPDPSTEWKDLHDRVNETVAEYGGKVAPKLNWSAPKDATWIAATNDMQCQNANDIYLLLKSSDFVTHDLEQAFEDCVPDEENATEPEIPYHLVLRKYVQMNPSLEFRCFVRDRVLLCMCQRDQNHYDFLFPMRDSLRSRIQAFFDEKLKDTFPDPSFVFDVYIPVPHQRVWLIDVNPWAIRTDPLLFSWLEILQMRDPVGFVEEDNGPEEQFVRLSLNGNNAPAQETALNGDSDRDETESEDEAEGEASADDDLAPFLPEVRLIKRDDPEAYAFTTPQYSAHKMPKEVVDASLAGPGGMSEFLGKWQDILDKQIQEDEEADSDE